MADPSPQSHSITASVVITSRNRRDDVLRAVESSLAQEGVGVEVLVYDDCSTDGTVAAVRASFPRARVFEGTQRVGYIVNRNRGFQDARGQIVFSIDDDAYFSETDIVARIVACFDADPGIAAVAIPYVEPLDRRSLSSLQAPFSAVVGQELQNYVGCAHAIRVDVARELGGYREYFVHQGEERDLCLRMRARGLRVVYGDSGWIVHMVSPNRDPARINYFGARNQLLFNWLNLPLAVMLVRMAWDPWAMLRYRFSLRTSGAKLRGMCAGLWQSIRRFGDRSAVSHSIYRHHRSLSGHGPEVFEGEIPAPVGIREEIE